MHKSYHKNIKEVREKDVQKTCFFTAFHHYFELLETNGDHMSLQTYFFTAFHHYFELLETNRDHMSLQTCFTNHFSAEKARCVELFDECRTFSNLIYTVVPRCVGYLYTVSEWFNPLEPPRTFLNHFSAEKARCVEVFDVSSEWFDCTEPSRTSSSQW